MLARMFAPITNFIIKKQSIRLGLLFNAILWRFAQAHRHAHDHDIACVAWASMLHSGLDLSYPIVKIGIVKTVMILFSQYSLEDDPRTYV